MSSSELQTLPDVQSAADTRRLAITRVGVKGLRYPLRLDTPGGDLCTVASIDMYVALPAERKGTHMSRFVALLRASPQPWSGAALPQLLEHMLVMLEAQEGEIAVRFPYFITKAAPVSGVPSLMDYDVLLHVSGQRGAARVRQKVLVPVTSLCPCSKTVADYGAHNQRAHLSLDLELSGAMSIEEQVRLAEAAASCEVWSLLKRADEKYVTERAYDNPKFVEDTVRDLALALLAEPRVLAYRIEAENFESIHNHSAYALIEHDRRTSPAPAVAAPPGA